METCPDHTAHKEHFKRLDARVLELEEDGKELARIAGRITVLIDKYDEKLDEHDARLAALESVPARRWESVVNYAIATLSGTALGVVVSHLGQ